MGIAERHLYRSSGHADTKTSKAKVLRHAGAVLLGLAIVLAWSTNAAAQQAIWPSTAVPATVDSGPSGPVELGVSFKSDTGGSVTAIRFYKSAANTGLHVGHLWSRTGALLASITFTGETASGWQQANLSTPVAITANTVYVASYQSTIGHWSVSWNYFANSGVNNPPLHALKNGSGAPDGVWGSAGAFPSHTNSSNYWVDVVFKNAAAVAPSITAQPASQTVTAGQTATFSVTATGTAPLTYQWKKNNVAVGVNASSYTTPATTSTDNATQFTVTISNTAGSVTSNAASLTVNVPPSITAQPASQTVTAGQTATFSVTATGTAPLTYQWKKNNVAVGVNASSYTTPATTSTDNATQFTVTISNTAGSVTSNAASLTVNVPPSITAQPASQTVTAGQTATFSVTATGTAPLTYQWKKNSVAVGVNASSYTTPATTSTDNAAQFTATISNTTGSLTSNAASLTVNVPPTITAQPASQTVTAGQQATFSVTAAGTTPFSYQWYKTGTAIGGANSASYTTPITTTADSGAQFTVAISNVTGNVTSSNALLTVNPLLPAATYACNEGSGNTTTDSSSNGNTATLFGPSWTTAGRYGNALSFNGTSAYVEAANSNSLNPGPAATFSAWVNVLAANADISSVINKWSQTIDDEYLFGLDSSNRLTFTWQTTGGNVWGPPSYYIVTGNAQIPLGTWTYITVVRKD